MGCVSLKYAVSPVVVVAAAILCGLFGCSLKTSGELPADGSTHDGPDCEAGQIACGEFCTDPDTDRFNCGECGNVCDLLEECDNGTCKCKDPYEDCGGTCVDPRIDRRNCGMCGNECDPLAQCVGGRCVCPPGWENCGGKCVDLSTDPKNCGACGNACTGERLCNGAGECSLECEPGYAMCGMPPDRFCADLDTDVYNCGECFNACSFYDHSTPLCDAGDCDYVCDVGYGDANGEAGDGCECPVTGGGIETCDGIDNDCNGTADDPFDCALWSTEACTRIASCTGWRQCREGCSWGSLKKISPLKPPYLL